MNVISNAPVAFGRADKRLLGDMLSAATEDCTMRFWFARILCYRGKMLGSSGLLG